MPKPAAEIFLKLLSPCAPHNAEELWEKLNGTGSVLEGIASDARQLGNVFKY